MSESSSSKDSPPNESSSNPMDSDSSTPSEDTQSPPASPESESESEFESQSPPPPPKSSPPSDNTESPPPQSSSSPSTPPSSSNTSPPPPPDSSPSSSPPPPPPEEEKAPPPPPSTSTSVSAPPPKDRSPISKKSPPPPPAKTAPPPPPPPKSSSPILPSVPASTPPLPSPTIPNPSPPNTNNTTTPATPAPKTNAAASTPAVRPSPSMPPPPPPRVPSDKFHVHHSVGPIIGVTLVAVLLSLLAIFFVMVMRKKRKMSKVYYRPPPPRNFSVRSDAYYYNRTTNPTAASSSRSSSYYASQRMSTSGASGIMYDSNGGYGHHNKVPPDPTGPRSCFTYEELMDLTRGFAQENVIGQGGFGSVYKGVLPDGRRVAVKQLKAGSGQGEREFRAEVEIIIRVHHRHLVSLVGYCIADHHRLLVYEFVPNGTLEHHLHGMGLPVMEWSKRLKIAIGSARGLAYLHEDCHPRIIHRDIKSANILLDDCFEAQVADFGLAKLTNDTNTHVSTRVMGTFGYMAPEYASSGKLTDRSDVYSFGVVLLELITGRKPVDASQPLGDESLVEWVRPLLVHAIETGNLEELVDPRLEGNYAKTEMSRMIEAAAACVRHSAPKRPRMVQVVRALDSEGDMTDLTNGVKVGQSQVYNSGQYSSDIRKFRQMAFGSSGEYESSEYGHSGGEASRRSAAHSGELRPSSSRHIDHQRASGYSNGQESETSAVYRRDRSTSGGN